MKLILVSEVFGHIVIFGLRFVGESLMCKQESGNPNDP